MYLSFHFRVQNGYKKVIKNLNNNIFRGQPKPKFSHMGAILTPGTTNTTYATEYFLKLLLFGGKVWLD